MKKPAKKRTGDAVQIAHSVMQDVIAASEGTTEPKPAKNPAAVELGRLGGLKGGKARAESLSQNRRKEIARLAAQKRWRKEAI